MFVVTQNLKLRHAQQKAYDERPDVFTDALGSYRVEGSGGNYYSVSVAPVGHRLTIHCECTAGMYGNECYHAAAALESYEAELARVAAAAAAAQPPARDARLSRSSPAVSTSLFAAPRRLPPCVSTWLTK